MPYKSKRQCGHMGCPVLVEAGTRYCPEHRKQYNKRANAAHYDTDGEKLASCSWQRIPSVLNAERLDA